MPANGEKGQVTFVSAGVTFTLEVDIDAICVVETLLDKSWRAICALLATERVTIIRAVLWGGLRKHHPDVTLQVAGQLIAGMNEPVLTVLTRALKKSNPDATEGAGASAENPPPATASGDGATST